MGKHMIRGALARLRTSTRASALETSSENIQMMLGSILARQVSSLGVVESLHEVEFKVFSQFGDDGIVHYLTTRLAPPSRTFIEFGVEDYSESTTRFLMMHQGWAGLVMDGSHENIARLRAWPDLWRFDLESEAVLVDRDNIDSLLARRGFPTDVGLLHIDVDGNDYWIWERISVVAPIVAVVEYNSVFGLDRRIAVPYHRAFERTVAHPSNLYWGASLPALHALAQDKGYAFVGCNSAGNNAYFVRRDHLRNGIREIDLVDGYVESRFRESRDADGRLTHLGGGSRLEAIRGLPVVNLETMTEESL